MISFGDSLSNEESKDRNSFFEQIENSAKIIKEYASKGEFIRVVSHIDADGLSAASILCLALNKMEVPFRIRIGKQLDEELIKDLVSENESLIIFVDFGSGSLDLIKEKLSQNQVVVLDHHQPMDVAFPKLWHVNPHLSGFNGASEISGAGVAYFVSKALDQSNVCLASLAVVGALGDAQDKNEKKKLVGLNEDIVKDAVDSGYLQVDTDLIFYGRETRPIHKALAYTTNPFIPDLSGEEDKCLGFLVNLGIKLKENDQWRSISDLNIEEKQKIFSEISKHLSVQGFPDNLAMSLIGTIYTLTKEDRWTPLRDAREYASLLNACGKLNRSGLGVSIGIGSRSETLEEAQTIFNEYKKTLSGYLDWVTKTPRSIEKLENINVIDGSGVIEELMLSTIASILISSNFFNDTKPIIAITTVENKTVKVSGRIPNNLRNNKLNLGTLFQEASARFNGRGGGHNVAAGAQLPKGAESEFLRFIDQQIGNTLQSTEP